MGNKKTITIDVKIIKDINGNDISLILVNDITQIKDLMKQGLKDKMSFLYFTSVAHDLKTPVNSLMGVNQNLQIRFKANTEILRLLDI